MCLCAKNNQQSEFDTRSNLLSRDRLIHQLGWYNRPIFGFCQHISIGQNGLSRYWQNTYIPHASRQLAQESTTTKQVKTVILHFS